jgi:hypothetical protein
MNGLFEPDPANASIGSQNSCKLSHVFANCAAGKQLTPTRIKGLAQDWSSPFTLRGPPSAEAVQKLAEFKCGRNLDASEQPRIDDRYLGKGINRPPQTQRFRVFAQPRPDADDWDGCAVGSKADIVCRLKADTASQFMNEAVGAVPRTVCIGGMRKDEILSALKERGILLNEIAQSLFAHQAFETADARSTMEIAEVSVRDLGLTSGATLEQVFERAAEHGLALCPLELAAHLRLQFSDQPEGFLGYPLSSNRAPPGALTIGARPIASGDGAPMGFYLRRIQGVLWLRGYRSPAEHVWDADDRFVFRRHGKDPLP